MKHSLYVTVLLVVLFAVSQLIGLAITQSYIDYAASAEGELVWKPLPSIAGVDVERPDVEPEFSIWYILGATLIGTILILLIIRWGKVLIWKLWFYFAVVLCLLIALGAFLSAGVALACALILGYFKVFKPNIFVHNFTELFVYGGLAVIFVPILNVFYAFALIIALSFYDMYAVWKSKHMIKMAKFQTKSGIFAGLLLPYALPKKGKKKRKVRTAVLGGGDIGFPLIVAGTVLKASTFTTALYVSAGATAALLFLLWLGNKNKFYPAMPFLSIGCLAGYGLSLLL